LAWAVVFGVTIASSALTYASTYATAASRRHVAAVTGTDLGLRVLLGPVGDIGTVGGYTVYKCFVTLTCIGALWGLFAATRLLRGEEDAGRWQLVLAGAIRPARATAATLAGIGGGVFVLAAGATAITAVAATDHRLAFAGADILLYGCSLAVAPLVFAGVGAVTSQLAQSRRVANALGMVVFAVAMVVRMLADAGASTRWLLWLTPFGWIERVRPFTAPDGRSLIVALAVVTFLVVGAVMLAARRDVGDGVVVARDRAEARAFGLRNAWGLAVRQQLGSIVGWLVGVTLGGLALGVVAQVADDALSRSSADVLHGFGVSGTLVQDYFGVAFLLLAATIALVPAPQLTSLAEDDADGRLGLVVALPVRRWHYFVSRLLLAIGVVTAAAVLAATGAWFGAESQGVDIALGTLLGAGLNVVPVAAVVLGIGLVVLALVPRAAAPTVYAVVIGSLVISLLASLVASTRWLERLSLFHYMALAPARPVDATAAAALLGVALALYLVATVLFARRNLST
jgi:ABC-2 type transport system permease protein